MIVLHEHSPLHNFLTDTGSHLKEPSLGSSGQKMSPMVGRKNTETHPYLNWFGLNQQSHKKNINVTEWVVDFQGLVLGEEDREGIFSTNRMEIALALLSLSCGLTSKATSCSMFLPNSVSIFWASIMTGFLAAGVGDHRVLVPYNGGIRWNGSSGLCGGTSWLMACYLRLGWHQDN